MLLAFGVAFPAMLFWSLAALAPILIHLFSRGKRRETVWAAMRFLEAAVRKNVRRIRVEQLLLLTLRVLLLAVLALALADPWWRSGGADAQDAAVATHWVFVIDLSYSMQQLQGEETALQQAKRRVEETLEDARVGDGFSLIALAEPAVVLVGEPVFQRDEFIAEVRALNAEDTGASLLAALGEAERVLQRAADLAPRLTRRRVLLFSDLQAATWAEADSEECRRVLARLAALAELQVATVGQGDAAENVAATALEVRGGAVLTGQPTSFHIALRNFGDSPREVPCALRIEDRVVQRQTISLAPGASGSWNPTHLLNEAGSLRVEAVLGDDALAVDNTARLALQVREAVRVLCVEGAPGAARAVALALDPNDPPQRRVQWEIAPESALLERELADYDSIWLCSVARLLTEEADVLDAYVRRGGCLMIFLGPNTQADNYNAELADRLNWLPARLESPAGPGDYALDPLDYQHWLTQPFEGSPNAGLLTTPIWNYWRLAPVGEARVALAVQGGAAAVAERDAGQGLVVLCGLDATHPAGQDPAARWSGLSAWPSFPPLIQQISNAFSRRRREAMNLEVGQAIRPLTTALTGSLTVQWPDGAESSLAVAPPDGDASAASAELLGTRAGFYRVASRDHRQLFAVNLNTRESDLRTAPAAQLPMQLRTTEAGVAEPPPEASPRGLFRWLLLAALGLVVAETWLAAHFRRRQP